MKNNQLTGMLVGLLFLSTLLSVALIFKYNSAIHSIEELEPKLVEVNKIGNVMQGFLNETVEYSRTSKNPDMQKLLQSFSNNKTIKTTGK